jgi:hypothetical protein
MNDTMNAIVLATLAMFLVAGTVTLLALAARILGYGPSSKMAAAQIKRINDAETAGEERATAGRVRLQ